MRFKLVLATTVTTVLTVAFTAALSSTANASNNNPINPDEVTSALSKVGAKNRNLVKNVEPSSSINVSTDPTKGVAFSSPEGLTMRVDLPDANPASNNRGIQAKSGIIAYGGSNGSASAVVPMNNGVQFLIVIKNRKAPDKYTYPVTLPEGGRIVTAPHGAGAAVVDSQGRVIAGIEAPWAKDSNGRNIRTYFSTDGRSLTQHVAHNRSKVAYPVVSDPIVVWLMGVTLYCMVKGTYKARNLRGQRWYVWLWGLTLACLPI